jgi:molecular chaperone DnaK (HSP70)
MSSHCVGIDLGTTHTVVAHGELGSPPAVFPLPQLVGRAEVDALPLLASALFTPAPSDAPADPYAELPWIVGEYALRRGREVPLRLVVSAKSWLCHPGVDRRAPILPWGASDAGIPKISPVEASRRILEHVQKTWDAENPARPLRRHNVVLTVPASFDEVARELTVEAAREAGLNVRLLEEPQAAFYDYLEKGGARALETLLAARERARVLVCDVGGGTTDLTLIEARRRSGDEIDLTRVAVGRHLLLGGDNIDLALAHACERKLGDEPLDPVRFAALLLACRSAKERLLGASPPDSVPIRVAGSGAALVGNTLATELTRGEVETLVFEGFLPLVQRGAPGPKPRAGLVSFGLPYERDPAISRHILAFLDRHAAEGVDAVLFNGGLFKSERAAERVRELIGAYRGAPVEILPFAEPDLAVARGAVAYGLTLKGRGTRIGGGTSRGYYVAVDTGAKRRAVCVVPKGAREGERHTARPGGLRLRVGQTTAFELFTSDTQTHAPGDIVDLSDDFASLPPISATFAGDTGTRREVAIALEGELTPVGTIDLACVELEPAPERDPRHFRLAFELRERPREAPSAPPSKSLPPRSLAPAHPNLDAARDAIERVFGEGRHDVKPREVKDLVRELERLLGERPTWTLDTNRALFDALSAGRNARRRSEDHERVFWMLAGYTLRPGFGDARDGARVGMLVPMFETGVTLAKNPRAWQQFWIAWRRVGGGLKEETQVRIRDAIDPFLAPAELKLKKRKTLKAEAPEELLELAASLERIPVERRVDLGRWVLERTWTDRDPRLWAALGRLGARVPAYGSAHQVIPIRVAEEWVDHLLRTRWSEVPTAAHAALQMARVTGDRTRDLAASVREEVAKRLREIGALPGWVTAVTEFVPIGLAEQAELLGGELPVGLVLG